MTRQRTHYREFNVASGESDTPEFSVETHQDRTEVRLREQAGQTQAIFSVLDANGDVIFEVTPDGVEFDVDLTDDSIAGTKLADAVAGSGLSKDGSENLQVNVDGSTIEIATDTLRVKDAGITTAKLLDANVTGAKLAAAVAGSGLAQNGSGNLDVTVDGVGLEINADTLRLKDSGVATAKLADDAVTYAKMQNAATDRLIGRDTAGTGDPEELTVGGGIEFTGSGGIQRSALTGAVTASAGSGTTALANDAVTTTKILDANVTTAKLADKAVTGAKIGENRGVTLAASDLSTAITTGDGKAYWRVPSILNNMNLVSVASALAVAQSSSGIPTVQIARVRSGTPADMLSTKLTIDANESDSSTAATAAVIDTGNDDVQTGDIIRIDIDVAGTGAKGLIVELQFQNP